MAGPLAGLSAAQLAAQQKVPEQVAQQQQGVNKAGPSKFDQVMKSTGADAVGQARQVDQVRQTQRVEQLNKLDPARLQKVDQNVTGRGMDPVTQTKEVSRSGSLVMDMVGNIERGQVVIDKLLNSTLTGKKFNNTELLALQAGMYKYSQELDLCSKVVEKATSGLKDTLKTQV